MIKKLIKKSQNQPVRSKEIREEYFCPHCESILNEQEVFNPNEYSWTCKKCSQLLYGNVYEGDQCRNVMWYCDKCHTLLNRQPKFSDICTSWICVECGYENELSTVILPNLSSDNQKEEKSRILEKSKPIFKKALKWTVIVGGAVATVVGTYLLNKNTSMDNSENIDTDDLKTATRTGVKTCANCGFSLSGSAYTAPWENGKPRWIS